MFIVYRRGREIGKMRAVSSEVPPERTTSLPFWLATLAVASNHQGPALTSLIQTVQPNRNCLPPELKDVVVGPVVPVSTTNYTHPTGDRLPAHLPALGFFD